MSDTNIERTEPENNVVSVEDFESLVLSLINNATRLRDYDYFASLAIINIIQLMLSKSDEFVKQVQKGLPFDLNKITRGDQQNSIELEIPEEIKSEVDAVIATIQEKLSSEGK